MEQQHILVVDDNQDLLGMLNAMLKMKGYKVTLKENADNLEDLIKEQSPNIIIMDMLLSGSDGREVCKQIKSNPDISSIPILMLSAHPEAKEGCMTAGANEFLAKPFEMKELFRALTNLHQTF